MPRRLFKTLEARLAQEPVVKPCRSSISKFDLRDYALWCWDTYVSARESPPPTSDPQIDTNEDFMEIPTMHESHQLGSA